MVYQIGDWLNFGETNILPMFLTSFVETKDCLSSID